MPIITRDDRFVKAHQRFLQHMEVKANGQAFESFQHPFLVSDEIEYKTVVAARGRAQLQLEHWPKWREDPAAILRAVRNACSPQVSANLLQHKYGPTQSSARAVFIDESDARAPALAAQIYDFYCGGPADLVHFGPRFDALAEHLRQHSLGARWDFISYLTYLLDPQRYFHVMPSAFKKVLAYYGEPVPIAGLVTWDRYLVMLRLLHELRDKLLPYGTATVLELQSYVWVVSYLLEPARLDAAEPDASEQLVAFDFEGALQRRRTEAGELNRIGLAGERLVYKQEVARLLAAGRRDLASRVVHCAGVNPWAEYDILSFDIEGHERHLEVKTTMRSRLTDGGFYLSEQERRCAEQDPDWRLVRVWEIDGEPTVEDLGHIVHHHDERWQMEPLTWIFRKAASRAVSPGVIGDSERTATVPIDDEMSTEDG